MFAFAIAIAQDYNGRAGSDSLCGSILMYDRRYINRKEKRFEAANLNMAELAVSVVCIHLVTETKFGT